MQLFIVISFKVLKNLWLIINSNTHHHFLRDILLFCQTRWGGADSTAPGCRQWDGGGDNDNDGKGDNDIGRGDIDGKCGGDILIARCYLVISLMLRQDLASNQVPGGGELIGGGVQRHHHRQLWQSSCPCLRQVGQGSQAPF